MPQFRVSQERCYYSSTFSKQIQQTIHAWLELDMRNHESFNAAVTSEEPLQMVLVRYLTFLKSRTNSRSRPSASTSTWIHIVKSTWKNTSFRFTLPCIAVKTAAGGKKEDLWWSPLRKLPGPGPKPQASGPSWTCLYGRPVHCWKKTTIDQSTQVAQTISLY